MKRMALVVVGLLSVSCTPEWARENDSPVILRISKIQGQAGGPSAGTAADFLISDVAPVFNDNAVIVFEVIPKNRQQQDVLTGPINDVLVEQYEVRYIRSDGRNVEGVDVPFRFTGGMSVLVHNLTEQGVAVIVVRHQAKFEPPLQNLRSNATGVFGGAFAMSVVAELTFHGHTTSGKAVSATGRLNIVFADFAGTT
jgi:hypothetical protein